MNQQSRERRVWVLTQDRRVQDQVMRSAEAREIPCRVVGEEEIGELDARGGVLIVDTGIGLDLACHSIRVVKDQHGEAWYVCGLGGLPDAHTVHALQDSGADRVMQIQEPSQRLDQLLGEVYAA